MSTKSTTPKLQVQQKSEKVDTIKEAATTDGEAVGNHHSKVMNGYFGDDEVGIDDIPTSLELARHNQNLYHNLLDADALFIDMFRDDDMLSMWALSNTCTSGCDECMRITLSGCEGQSA